MDPESTSEVRAALAAFRGLADVAVIEHGVGQAGHCLIAYVVPTGPGLATWAAGSTSRQAYRSKAKEWQQ